MIDSILGKARKASYQLATLSAEAIDSLLRDVADSIARETSSLLEANASDLSRMAEDNPLYDRLRLTSERLEGIAQDMRKVASLPSPLGRTLLQETLSNGLRIKRVSVPFGVIGVVYEARPNVTFDVFSLCLKAGSACVLKGGKDADASNRKAVEILREALRRHGICEEAVTLLPATHEATAQLLHANGLVDLVIPRGSKRLIDFVRKEASVPVIETGAGVCHTYFDCDGNLEMGGRIVCNAKTRRVSVCNALDCLLVHRNRLAELPALCQALAGKNVVVHADSEAYAVLQQGGYPASLLQHATPESFGTEFLSLAMAIKVVDDVHAAIAHIRQHGSGHSECIVTDNKATASAFLQQVDAACVYHNAPTSFTDGAQFGLGAEIGISTQKLHARGPMALNEITTYKWIIEGDGQLRPA